MIKRFVFLAVVASSLLAVACGEPQPMTEGGLPTSLRGVPAVMLNYVYEADVPAPEVEVAEKQALVDPPVQAHFEISRPDEIVDRTLVSPDKRRVLAIYHRTGDLPAEFRLDMYTADGRLLNKITPDVMAVHFRDTIVWSPDSTAVAFVAMIRAAQDEMAEGSATPATEPTPEGPITDVVPEEPTPAPEQPEAPPAAEATPEAPTGILAFRTEQLYLADADGGNVRPITQSEGLMYFYYAWSPDSSMLAALAATAREWQYLEALAERNGEMFIPLGRPRIVERNGRERRLDDALTAVRPVWSPDSAKVATGFDTQIRIYDAVGTNPTQAAVPLRNALLISSQAFDRSQAEQLNAPPGAEPDANANAAKPEGPATLPDPASLVSFNPIVGLDWSNEQLLYFQTAFIKRMVNEADSVTSFRRWHRLILSPQAPPPGAAN
ncbi:MAG: hypothetical protein H0V76_07415 [Blastocatellia bacterium]|nr:hypothetical protein [Blastocatellia bacterium]